MSTTLRVRVPGTPQQQGSKTAFVIKGRAIMKDANEKALKPWRAQVAEAAVGKWGEQALILGPVGIVVEFAFPRPKSHYGMGIVTSTVLREDAPGWKTSTPDLDKLQRAIGDALSGVVFKDDAQVVWWNAQKTYTDDGIPFADITIIDLSGGSHDGRRTDSAPEGADSGPDRAR